MREHSSAILRTKLHRPAPTADAVDRSRLFDQLDQGYSGSVTLVSAPAGFGKSTLVSQWLEARIDIPAAWLSLDEGDNDLRIFLVYLLSALEQVAPGSFPLTTALASQEAPLRQAIVATRVINELAQIGNRVILVLDDFQRIDRPEVQALVTALIKRPLRTLHLVLVSRRAPPLPYATLRANGQISELRMDVLRFTRPELESFMEKSLGVLPAEGLADLVGKHTEGWPAALRLIALSLRATGDQANLIDNLHEIPGNLWDYLAEEVFSLQKHERQGTLLEISVVDRFCAALCETVCRLPRGGGEECVRWLTASNLFAIPLDETGTWFRFHHLFEAFLRKQAGNRFSETALEKLHRAAAQWFERQGLIEEALHHRMRGQDTGGAARLVAEHRHVLMNKEEWHRLDRWLNLLPPESISRDPRLLMARAWSREYHMRWPEAWRALDRIEALLSTLSGDTRESSTDCVEGEVYALRSYQQYLASNGKGAVVSGKRALELLPAEAASARGFALILLSASLQMIGDLKAARQLLYENLEEQTSHGGTLEARLLMSLAFVHWMEGDLSGLIEVAKRYRQLHREVQLLETEGFSRYFLGIGLFHSDKLEEAEQQLRPLLDIRFSTRPLVFVHGAFALALIRQARGFPDEAAEIAEQVTKHLLDNKIAALMEVARAFQAELALRRGRTREAIRWVEGFDPEPLMPAYFFFTPRLTAARALVATRDSIHLERADRLLGEMEHYFSEIHNHNLLLQVLLLRSRAKIAAGDQSAAEDLLRRFLRLAQARGFVRFQEALSPEVVRVMSRLELDDDGVHYLGRILAVAATDGPLPGAKGVFTTVKPVEPLSKREMEILTLMATALSNEEIGDKLFISRQTVKRHTATIYRKLGVHSREQAVAKAAGLGILA